MEATGAGGAATAGGAAGTTNPITPVTTAMPSTAPRFVDNMDLTSRPLPFSQRSGDQPHTGRTLTQSDVKRYRRNRRSHYDVRPPPFVGSTWIRVFHRGYLVLLSRRPVSVSRSAMSSRPAGQRVATMPFAVL